MFAVLDSQKDWVVGQRPRPLLWAPGSPARGGGLPQLPAPDLAAWRLTAPPLGAVCMVCPSDPFALGKVSLPSRGRAVGEPDWVPSKHREDTQNLSPVFSLGNRP